MHAYAWLLCVIAIGTVPGCFSVYSNSLELESVTTFANCNNASAIDPVTQAQVCLGDNKPITVIQYFVLPDQNDQGGGSGMEFYTYPQPFTNMPVNQQNGAPTDNPCQQASATTNCTYFQTPGTNDTGAITMTVKVSSVVRKYKVKQILDKKTVPYSYLNYAATVPKCDPEFCYNDCRTNDFNNCNPSTSSNTKTSFYACCAIQDDYLPDICGYTDLDIHHQGDIFSATNELYSYNGQGCGASDADLLYNYGQPLTYSNEAPYDNTGACRACSDKYGYLGKTVANRNAKSQQGRGCPVDSKGNVVLYARQEFPYPTTMPDLCPVPLSHGGGYPATTGDRESGANADGYAAEPYYYWCQASCVGTASYSSKYLEYKDSGKVKWYLYQDYCDVDTFPIFDGENLVSHLSVGGEGQDMYAQYMRAYDCGIDIDQCPQLQFAANVIDEGGFPCCNTTYDDTGTLINTCGETATSGLPNADLNDSCGGIAYEQVGNAISYLTAACNAKDSGELICGDDCVDSKDYSRNVGWTCPGSKYDHISPGVVSDLWQNAVSSEEVLITCDTSPCQSTSAPDASLSVAKCSAECSADPFIRYTNEPGKTCKGDKCVTGIESLTSQKAIVGLGGPACQVYQVIPQPILDVTIEVTFTDPAGNFNTSTLSTDGTAPAFGTTYLDDVAFTTRINQVYSVGSTGPDIPGYFVVCGMNSAVQSPSGDDEEPCVAPKGPYNPYDPPGQPATDDDIIVEKPSLASGYCASTDSDTQFRGIFPGSDPHTNPWPQLIRKMVQSRTLSKDYIQFQGYNEDFSDEAYACAVPSPRYYGVLNCGKPVFYYYVPEERKGSYGLTCSTLGVQNNFADNPTNARTMCLQDQNSCTPGYGLPKFTSGNAPFLQSPCQELGNMVKQFRELYDTTNDQSLNVCDGKIPQAWNMPGFRYLKETDQYVPPGGGQAEEVVGVPNTWFHEGYIYQQLVATEQQQIRFDMSTYTDTFFGGSFLTYANGIIVLDPANTTVCVATVGSQPGILVVGVENTNLQSGGTYSLKVYCVNPQDDSNLTANSQGGEAVIQPDGSGVLLMQVPAGATQYVNWGISATGYVPPATPNNDTLPDDDSVGLPTCVVSLYTGALAEPTFLISTTTINCNLLALNIIQNQKSTDLLTSIETEYTCGQYSLVVLPFCWLGNLGPVESSEIVLIFVLAGLACALLGYFGLRQVRSQEKLEAVVTQFTLDEHEAELAKERRQAVATESLVQRTLKKQNVESVPTAKKES